MKIKGKNFNNDNFGKKTKEATASHVQIYFDVSPTFDHSHYYIYSIFLGAIQ